MVEGKSSKKDAVESHSQRPHITLLPIVPLLKHLAQHLWSHEVVSPFTAPESLLAIGKFDSPTEVDDLDLEVGIEEDVLRFDVPMHNVVGVY